MKQQEMMGMQQRLKDLFAPRLVVDGFWGPVCQRTCREYLKSLMPRNNPWPRTDAGSLQKFYGAAGDESRLVTINFPFPMFYDGKRVLRTRVNERCAESLLRVLTRIGKSYGSQRSIMEEAEDYGGLFNNRNKRGGTSKSLHAFGAAIDLDADDNTFRDSWPLKADMPLEIMEEFAREGWVSAGAFWGYDAMHFQATR